MKKAQGLSVNTIVITAIALIVLVVLIAIFTGRIGLFGQGIDAATKQYSCVGASSSANAGEDATAEERAANTVDGLSGQWRVSCLDGEKPALKNFVDSKGNEDKFCCVAR